MRAPARAGERGTWYVLAALTALAALLVAETPGDRTLGSLLRLVLFHGATTWVNLATFTLAAGFSVGYLGLRQERLYPWAAAFRYVSLALWMVNATLGVISMRLAWGGVLLSEPRMRMTLGVLIAALALLLVDLIFESRRLVATLDVALGGSIWVLLLTTPKFLHPDNPVLNSKSADIVGFFAAQVVVVFVLVVVVTRLVRDRVARPAPAGGDG